MDALTYQVGKWGMRSCEQDFIDPRGILWVFEPPRPNASYVLGVDPTLGIAGWNRTMRTKDDLHKDNAAIEVFRCGTPDVQVAEYAAPNDPYDFAEIVNFVGRMYGGNDEDGQALTAIEVYPGQGLMVRRELISRFGFMRFPPWRYEERIAPRPTNRDGWWSNRETRQQLWGRGISHLQRKGVVLYSPWLKEEMADCTPDSFFMMSGRARHGLHDDRVLAMLIALWFANEWSMSVEPTETAQAESGNAPAWQASDCTVEAMMEAWDERMARLLDD